MAARKPTRAQRKKALKQFFTRWFPPHPIPPIPAKEPAHEPVG